MKKLCFYFCYPLIFLFFSIPSFGQAPLVDFQYWDTIAYEEDGFRAQKTYLNDINNHRVMVGYFENEEGNHEGFVFFENYKMQRLAHEDYTHTEFTGINDFGFIIAVCYDVPANKQTFYVKLRDPDIGAYNTEDIYKNELNEFTTIDFAPMGGTANRDPRKLSNNGTLVGSIQYSGTPPANRYIYRMDIFFFDDAYHRYMSGSTLYGTFGGGISSNGEHIVGYYIDAIEYNPVILNTEDDNFYKISPPATKTKMNGVNNDLYAVYEYQTPSGIWKGMLAKLNPPFLSIGSYSVSKFVDFSFNNDSFGGNCTGINDSTDIVGYIHTASDRTVAYFAVTHEWKVPDFDFEKDVFPFKNSKDELSLLLEHWTDPYIYLNYEISDSPFVSMCYEELIERWSPVKLKKFLELGSIEHLTKEEALEDVENLPNKFNNYSPDFLSYVFLRGEDQVYIDGKVKIDEIYKFDKVSNIDFDGYCYGMCMGVVVNLIDSTLLQSRFASKFPLPSKKHAKDYDFSEFSSIVEEFGFKRALGSMHLSQNLSNEYNQFTQPIKEHLTDVDASVIQTQSSLDRIAKGLMDKNTWRILGKTERDEISSDPFLHATLPYKIVRRPGAELLKHDTIYAYNPNIPDRYVFYTVMHDGESAPLEYRKDYTDAEYVLKGYFRAGVGPSFKDFEFFKEDAESNLDIYEKTSSNFNFNISTTADILIENSETELNFEKVDTNISYTMDGYVNYAPTQTINPISFKTNSTFLAKTTISEAEDGYAFGVDYVSGYLGVRRTHTNASQIDFIYHDEDYQKIENPDSEEKDYTITTIYNPSNNEESFLEIGDISLAQDDTITLVNLDQYRFLLMNGNEASNTYRLRVRYLSEDRFFHVSYENIEINPSTNHLILLQPGSESHPVIILSDQNQDGEYEDTIYVEPTGIYELEPQQLNVAIYPNPSASVFNIELQSPLQSEVIYEVSDINGRQIHSSKKHIGAGQHSHKINLSDQAPGVYHLRIRIGHSTIYTEKLIKL